MRRGGVVLWVLATLGAGLFVAAMFGLRDDAAVARYEFVADDAFHTPMLVLQPQGWVRGPSVILIHGYSGSKEMMQAIARALARSGMAVYCPDLPGSGDSRERYRPQDMPVAASAVYDYLLAKGYIQNGSVALVGHSMGATLAAGLAMKTDGIRATVEISSAPVQLEPARPRNVLAIVGSQDLVGLPEAAARAMGEATREAVSRSGQETGEVAAGTARRFVVVEGANHLDILYSLRTIREIQAWFVRSFGLGPPAQPSHGMLWIGISYAGVLFLFVPLAFLMGAVKPPRAALSFDQHAGWRSHLMCLFAALLSIMMLRYWSPLAFIHIEAGSYLASFFLLTGLIRIVLTRLTQTPDPALDLDDPMPSLLFGIVSFLFIYLTFGAATHRNWLYMLEGAGRLRWFAVVAVGIFPFFIEDEKVARSVQEDESSVVSYFYSMGGKVCVLACLLLPILSSVFRAPRFLLSMSFPFMVVFFAVFQLLSVILYSYTRRVLTTAVFNTLIFAWLLTAPFVQI